MLFRKRIKGRNVLMTIGMNCLLIALVGRWFFHPATPIGADVADGIYGVLMGLAIAFNLMSVRRSTRCPGSEA